MSGGSYNYLCHKDVEELLNSETNLREMSDALAELGYADDAARETEDLLLTLRAFRNRIDVRLKRLRPVWKAVEWWHSCDSAESCVKDALKQYRGDETD